jgi:hypothetical protein
MSDTFYITVEEQEINVEVREEIGVILEQIAGPQGPTGPQGLPGNGSSTPYSLKTADYYLTAYVDCHVDFDCANLPLTAHLPLSTLGNAGELFILKKVDQSANALTVITANGQPMEYSNYSSIDIDLPGESLTFKSNGSGYTIL